MSITGRISDEADTAFVMMKANQVHKASKGTKIEAKGV